LNCIHFANGKSLSFAARGTAKLSKKAKRAKNKALLRKIAEMQGGMRVSAFRMTNLHKKVKRKAKSLSDINARMSKLAQRQKKLAEKRKTLKDLRKQKYDWSKAKETKRHSQMDADAASRDVYDKFLGPVFGKSKNPYTKFNTNARKTAAKRAAEAAEAGDDASAAAAQMNRQGKKTQEMGDFDLLAKSNKIPGMGHFKKSPCTTKICKGASSVWNSGPLETLKSARQSAVNNFAPQLFNHHKLSKKGAASVRGATKDAKTAWRASAVSLGKSQKTLKDSKKSIKKLQKKCSKGKCTGEEFTELHEARKRISRLEDKIADQKIDEVKKHRDMVEKRQAYNSLAGDSTISPLMVAKLAVNPLGAISQMSRKLLGRSSKYRNARATFAHLCVLCDGPAGSAGDFIRMLKTFYVQSRNRAEGGNIGFMFKSETDAARCRTSGLEKADSGAFSSGGIHGTSSGGYTDGTFDYGDQGGFTHWGNIWQGQVEGFFEAGQWAQMMGVSTGELHPEKDGLKLPCPSDYTNVEEQFRTNEEMLSADNSMHLYQWPCKISEYVSCFRCEKNSEYCPDWGGDCDKYKIAYNEDDAVNYEYF
jgi:hypothetical protein